MSQELDKYQEYAKQVLSGEINACKHIKNACSRYLSWFDRDDIEFRPDKADKVVNFASKLKHSTGSSNGKPFILLPWQRWVVYSIYGWYRKGTNKRVVRNAYIEIARKNGKSSFAAMLCLYALIADGENGAEVELLANSAKQAGIAFEMCSNYISTVDPKGKLFRRFRDRIKFDATKSFLQVLSTDCTSNDGWNSHFYLVDEYHSSPDSRMYDVMKTSQGFRQNPLAVVITTAGLNLNVPCYEMRQANIEIIQGIKQDDSTFAAIFTLDDGDNWEDENNWIKANPSLGDTVQVDYLREMVIQAKNNPSTRISTLTKNFNIWVNQSSIWIPNEKIAQATQTVDVNSFKNCVGFLAFDLAAVSDLTALSLCVPLDEKYYIKTWYFLPNDTIEISPNREKYKKWINQGYLIKTNGNVTDYDEVVKVIKELSTDIIIESISYDQWNSQQLVIDCQNEGWLMTPFSQSVGNFSRYTKEFERMLLSGQIILDNNPITRWCFSNVDLYTDINENVKPRKQSADGKIDGVISAIMSLGGVMNSKNFGFTELMIL